MSGPVHSGHQTGPSGFSRFRTDGGFEDYRTRDNSSASLVSSRTHAQPEEEDPTDEDAKEEGRSGLMWISAHRIQLLLLLRCRDPL
jgi:hypothetical protein